MKTQSKMIFTAALTVALTASRTLADTAPAGTNAAAGTNANPSATMASLFGDPVIAKGKGVEVRQSALDEVMLGVKSSYAAQHNEPIPPQLLTGYQGVYLNRLIGIQLLLQKATPADKAVGQAKAEETLTNLLAGAGSQEALDRRLKAVGMTPSELRTKITQEATATAALTRELDITVTDAEVTNFYASHPSDFEQPEMAHVAHILISTHDAVTGAELTGDQKAAKKKQIEDILSRARAGENFAALVKQYSDDPGSKDKGGEYTFPRGQMVPEFEAAAFSLNTNQISDVVTTQFGFHIIKLIDKTPAEKVPYAKVADKIKDFLVQQKTQKLAPPYLAGLTKAADVEILDPDLKAAAAAAALAAETNAPAGTP